MTPEYIIERHKLGWVLKGGDGRGVPVAALKETLVLFKEPVIVNFRISDYFGGAIAICSPENSRAWESQLGIKP